MHIQIVKGADRPRQRLSLRFAEMGSRPSRPLTPLLSTKELQRIVAEMID